MQVCVSIRFIYIYVHIEARMCVSGNASEKFKIREIHFYLL